MITNLPLKPVVIKIYKTVYHFHDTLWLSFSNHKFTTENSLKYKVLTIE